LPTEFLGSRSTNVTDLGTSCSAVSLVISAVIRGRKPLLEAVRGAGLRHEGCLSI
jgi:hypothetical protein